ncbi:MAG: carbohydrate kinase family protein [Candidatus Pacebacteria bacterium]|nr:carbohydrate kinase family protein [Candidatus Paceibacterota bacterium]
MKKFDIITFGSASKDIFVTSKEFFQRKLCFPIGDKIEIDKILIRTGGGGTNTATTFSLQGLKTAYCGCIGKDFAGFLVLMDLKKFGVATEFVQTLENKTTNHSVILSKKERGRVILAYRDASKYLPENFKLERLKAEWFYLAPLSGEFTRNTLKILKFAKQSKIKVAMNPSKEQIRFLKVKKEWSKLVDVLILNENEAKMLFGRYKNERSLFKKLKKVVGGYLVITKGERGSIIFDGKNIFEAGIINVKAEDRTGAGDAFGSGFVVGLIKKNDPIFAIRLATANAGFCLKEWGAKEGLLRRGQRYSKVKIVQTKI